MTIEQILAAYWPHGCWILTAILMAGGWIMARLENKWLRKGWSDAGARYESSQVDVEYWKNRSAEQCVEIAALKTKHEHYTNPFIAWTPLRKAAAVLDKLPEPEPPIRDPRQNPIAGDGVRFGDGEEWHVKNMMRDGVEIQGPDLGCYPNSDIRQVRQYIARMELKDWRLNVAETTVIMKSGNAIGGSVPYKPAN